MITFSVSARCGFDGLLVGAFILLAPAFTVILVLIAAVDFGHGGMSPL